MKPTMPCQHASPCAPLYSAFSVCVHVILTCLRFLQGSRKRIAFSTEWRTRRTGLRYSSFSLGSSVSRFRKICVSRMLLHSYSIRKIIPLGICFGMQFLRSRVSCFAGTRSLILWNLAYSSRSKQMGVSRPLKFCSRPAQN